MGMQALLTAAEQIWLSTQADCPLLSVEVLPRTDSTNTQLLQRGRQGDTAPTLLAALEQTAGRGRQGRQWLATPGDSLTFSLGMALDLERIPGGASALSLAVGLSLAESLSAQLPIASPGIQLKWPNDLWWRGRKLGGILIEATPAPGLTGGQRWVVIGIGLNLREVEGSPGFESTSLQACCGDAPGLGYVWQAISPHLIRTVQAFERDGFAPLQARYAARDALQGQSVALWQGAQRPDWQTQPPAQTGKAGGIDWDGALLVHTAEGLQRWVTGEVTVRLQQPISSSPSSPFGS